MCKDPSGSKRIGEQLKEKVEGHGGNWHIFGHQDLELPRELCPLPIPLLWAGVTFLPFGSPPDSPQAPAPEKHDPVVKIN